MYVTVLHAGWAHLLDGLLASLLILCTRGCQLRIPSGASNNGVRGLGTPRRVVAESDASRYWKFLQRCKQEEKAMIWLNLMQFLLSALHPALPHSSPLGFRV